MANEQIFEQDREERIRISYGTETAEPIVEATADELLDGPEMMERLGSRLTEFRTPPISRSVMNLVAWSSFGVLFFPLLASLMNPGIETLMTAALMAAALNCNGYMHRAEIAEAALTLQEYDHSWIGPLFAALAWPNDRIRQIVRKKLVPLLHTMTERDARFLRLEEIETIQQALEQTKDAELRIAILQALPIFGDAASIATAEKIANGRVWSFSAERVRSAARVCLPLLRERVRRRQDEAAERQSHRSASPRASAATDAHTVSAGGEGARQAAIAAESHRSDLADLEAEREKVARPAMRVAFLIADWLIIIPYCGYQTIDALVSHSPLLAAGFGAVTLGATQLYRVSLSSKRVAMMRKQAQQRDLKAVGLLAEALSWPEQAIQNEAGAALTVLLPLLKANNAALLTAAQRECLHQRLTLQNARTGSGLMVAILQSFQQIGDNAAIPYVERLAEAVPQSPQESRVVKEAQECLPYLRLCAGNNSASHSLLRASAMSNVAATDNLLRPVRESRETRPEQLLRPGDVETK
jgi:hypothetical protein